VRIRSAARGHGRRQQVPASPSSPQSWSSNLGLNITLHPGCGGDAGLSQSLLIAYLFQLMPGVVDGSDKPQAESMPFL
jgi:hypothetical protein